jgi:hypothetical protein
MSYRMDSPLSPNQVSRLLDELCVRLGFCLPPADTVRIQQDPPLDARDFANAVFLAEGMGASENGRAKQSGTDLEVAAESAGFGGASTQRLRNDLRAYFKFPQGFTMCAFHADLLKNSQGLLVHLLDFVVAYYAQRHSAYISRPFSLWFDVANQ